MRLEEWLVFYSKILSEFGFSRHSDEEAAKLMHEVAADKLLDLSALKGIIEGKSVAVIGYAVRAKELQKIEEEVKITAGKAILRAIELDPNFLPDIHVTDAEEGNLLAELEKKGCMVVLHVHGDNVERIKLVVPRLSKFVATTQSFPFNKIYNFGGFTDGDRAAILAKEMGASRINLYGFDFDGAREIKKKKLEWARRILEFEGIL
jgi:hypothetical protein